MTDTSDLTRADATRARLLEAAVEAFAAKGYHATTTRDIAAAAGMSPAALYVHHKSKEELLYLISSSGHHTVLQLVRDAISSRPSPTQALRQVVHDFAVHHAEGHTSARIVNYELSALSPDHYAEVREIRRDIEGELKHLVERGVECGEFDTPNPHLASVALLSFGIDLARWYREGSRWSAEEIATDYAEIALRVVGAPPNLA